MPIVKLKCVETGCNRPVVYARGIGLNTIEWCRQHGEELMRCKSNTVGGLGECLFCDADSGVACRAETKSK